MTLQEAKSIARHFGLTLRKVRSGHYRVNLRNGDESTACYALDLEDAVNAAEITALYHCPELGVAASLDQVAQPLMSVAKMPASVE